MYETLKNIISTKAQLKNYISDENSFYIKESDRLAKCKRVDLLKFESEDSTFAFELDSKDIRCSRKHKLSPYFEDKQGLDKGNDAIIFTTIKDKQYIFICELKDGATGYISQFKSSFCFVEYLKSILKTFHNFKLDDAIIKYIVFSTKATAVNPTNGKYISSNQKGFDIFHVNCKRKKYYIESFI